MPNHSLLSTLRGDREKGRHMYLNECPHGGKWPHMHTNELMKPGLYSFSQQVGINIFTDLPLDTAKLIP